MAVAGVILAGGRSARMGSPKALLFTRDGLPFVVSIAATFAKAGFGESSRTSPTIKLPKWVERVRISRPSS